ncbi:hypothetical protein [Bradyrhizobium japonicum]|uniref:hypothetical protein n=1 Tax=Bradyrhizobium japonicum TaxID=375 RepID=UPI0006947CCF|nr:hypothetical protein [Bradyrhizobium japonicum]
MSAEVAAQNLPTPFAKSQDEPSLKTEAQPDLLNIRRSGLVARDNRSGVTGRGIVQAEHESAAMAMSEMVERRRGGA